MRGCGGGGGRLAAGRALNRRGGFHIRPGVFAPPQFPGPPPRLPQNIKLIRRGGIYCARRRVSEANRRAAEALRPEIPPAEPCAAAGFPGRCKHRPLHGFATPQGCSFPFGRAFAVVRRGGPWPSRKTLRRCNFPVRRRVCPGSVGRAFTPAAPWQFQNRNVRAAAGCGGMRASRPTAARVAAAIPVGPKHEIDS